MKKILMSVIICMFVVVLFSGTAKTQSLIKTQSPIIGTWKTIDDEGPNKGRASSYITIFEKNGTYFGKITKLLIDPPDKVCDKCKGDLKNKPLIGMIILQDMKKTGNVDKKLGVEYADGTIMDPDNAETYKCKMWVKDDVLTSRGYIGISLFGRSQEWLRVK
jgi:uncharacterized protein (DUF2147 family)